MPGIMSEEFRKTTREQPEPAHDFPAQQAFAPEEVLRLFLEHSPVALAMFDREMRYLSASERWRNDYGLGTRELRGLSHYEVFPEIPEIWKEAHRRGLAGETLRAEGDRFDRLDGRVQWIRWEIRPWHRVSGDVGGILIFTEDITERKEAENALRESEAKLRSVLESSRDAVYRLNLQSGRYEFISPSTEDVLGLTVAEFSELTLTTGFDLIHPDDVQTVLAALARLEQEGTADIEYRLRSKSGDYRWLWNQLSLTCDPAGRPLYRNGVIRDITERKEAQKALLRSEKLASSGRMAAAIAHEINNPLAAVTNALFLALTTENLPDDVRRNLETADQELRRIAHITRQSLGFFRDSNAPASTCINEVLDSALEVMKSKIKSKQAVIEREWGEDVLITAVAGELRQIFANLIGNSLDAVDLGGKLKLRVSKGPTCVRVNIVDNGKGIGRDARQHLFEPFYTTKGAVGTGLGLWVSKQILDKHRGTILVRSRTIGPHRGTMVRVSLPIGAEAPNSPR